MKKVRLDQLVFDQGLSESRERAMDALAEALTDNPAWGALTAVREGRVVELDKSLFHYKPNARWADGYAYLAKILYPQLTDEQLA